LDKLCDDYDYSCRFNGGITSEPVGLPNGEDIRLLPFGIQNESNTKALVGNGVIIDPSVLLQDLDSLSNNGIEYGNKLRISDR
jgi:adenylosuccinate synthase